MIDTTEAPKRSRNRVISTHQYFNIYYKNKVPPIDLLPNYAPPEELVIMVFNRRLALRDQNERLLKKFEPILFGTMFPILATACTTGRELYEQVWMKVRSVLKHSCYERKNLWWDRTTEMPETTSNGVRMPVSPFVLKHVDMVG